MVFQMKQPKFPVIFSYAYKLYPTTRRGIIAHNKYIFLIYQLVKFNTKSQLFSK